jgi:hypothetical protein
MENPQKKVGRKPKIDKKNNWIGIRLTELEMANLQGLMEQSGQKDMSKFVRDCLFNREIRVVKTDASFYKTIELLTKILAQNHAVGVNYNQVVKHVNAHFGEQAPQLIKPLESRTFEFVKVWEQVKTATQKLMDIYHGKENKK